VWGEFFSGSGTNRDTLRNTPETPTGTPQERWCTSGGAPPRGVPGVVPGPGTNPGNTPGTPSGTPTVNPPIFVVQEDYVDKINLNTDGQSTFGGERTEMRGRIYTQLSVSFNSVVATV
jgi:hypothetical protein